MRKPKGRSAQEWSVHVAAWRRGGLTSSKYAEREGLSASSLRWWSWKLGPELDRGEAIELLPVEVVETEPLSAEGSVSWRLTTRDGNELCGVKTMPPELARALVTAVLGKGRRW